MRPKSSRTTRRFSLLVLLLAWTPVVRADLIINELLASNAESLRDADGDSSDWIEILHVGSTDIDLAGWSLTDDANHRDRWSFPSRVLRPGEFLIVFASGKNRASEDPSEELHSDFELDADGEYLALVRPDGSVAEEFSPGFPPQRTDLSFGRGSEVLETFLGTRVDVAVLVPENDALGETWRGSDADEPFPATEENGWILGHAAIGFDVGPSDAEPLAYWSFDDPTDSETALDSGPNELHGTITSQRSLTGGGAASKPVYTESGGGHTGSVGDYALDFGGASNGAVVAIESASAGAFDSLPAANEVTISVWIFGNASQPANDFLFWSSDRPDGSGTRTLNAHAPWGDGTIYWDTGGCCDGTQRISRAEPNASRWKGEWNHYAFIKRGDLKEIWQNGSLFYSDRNTAVITGIRSLVLGSGPGGGSSYGGMIDDVAIWDRALDPRQVEALAAGASPLSLSSLLPLIDLDLAEQLHGRNPGAFARFEFDVEDPVAHENLLLRARYDDGFVTWLDGVEVARRNAPELATLPFDASATISRNAEDAVRFEDIALTKLAPSELLRVGTNVLAVHALNASSDDDDFLFEVELLSTRRLGSRYFRTPTPGAENHTGTIGIVADTRFSVDRGYFDQPFAVEITTETKDAEIWFTLDGSVPSSENDASVRHTRPLRIDETTTLRAIATLEGHESSNVDTQTFLFIDEIARQPAAPPGLPTSWSGGFRADYEVDLDVVDHAIEGYSFREALRSIPSVSIVMPHEDLFGSSRGIYYHSGQKSERGASIEFIDLDGEGKDSFQVDAGVRIHGLTSRRHTFTPKHSIRVNFKSEHGPRKLRREIFPDTDVDRFDQFVLKGLSTDTWPVEDGWNLPAVPGARRWYRERAQYLREQWMKDAVRAMGQPAAHGYFVHVYLNGLYWGLYNLTERCTDSFHSEHFGGEREDYDVIRDFAEIHSGDKGAWNELFGLASTGVQTNAAYYRLEGRDPRGERDENLPVYHDVDNLIDYMIVHICAGADDWPNHNWWAGRRRGPDSGGFRFYPWDQEISNNDNNIHGWTSWRSRYELVNAPNSPAYLYDALRRNLLFQRRFGDRVHRHLFSTGGALTPAENDRRWMARATEIDQAIVGESARWGDHRRAHPYRRETDWLTEQAWIRDYWSEIHPVQVERFRNVGLYPLVDAPFFTTPAGRFEEYVEIRLDASRDEGAITYYTLDGSDPIAPGDKPSDTAIELGAAIHATFISESSRGAYLVPQDDRAAASWTTIDFNDGDWATGTAALGYDTAETYDEYFTTDLDAEMREINATVYVRLPFEIEQLPDVSGLFLRVRYDDGIIAYLNGTEIARANAPEDPGWDSSASAIHPDGDAIVFESFDVTKLAHLLRPGRNVLALHGLNLGTTSSDFLLSARFSVTDSVDATIPLSETTTIRSRTCHTGRWSALAEATYFRDIPLRITEIHYHPPESEEHEFLELKNIGREPIDLNDLRLEGAIEHAFHEEDSEAPALPLLEPGGVVLVLENPAAFFEKHDFATIERLIGNGIIAGPWNGRLSNRGEEIRLVGAHGEVLLRAAYDDDWLPETDGGGASLEIVDEFAHPDSWSLRESWRASETPDGTPAVHGVEIDPGGGQLPGDATQDARLDLSDAVNLLRRLFLDAGSESLCDLETAPGADLVVLDANGDRQLNLSDAIYLLSHLFLGGPAHSAGESCTRIVGCPDLCTP